MSTAFVPNELVEIAKEFENINLDSVEKPKDIYNLYGPEQLKRFDSYLGGIAFDAFSWRGIYELFRKLFCYALVFQYSYSAGP